MTPATTCPVCSQPLRQKFAFGSGKGARRQHPKLKVCDNGHVVTRKDRMRRRLHFQRTGR